MNTLFHSIKSLTIQNYIYIIAWLLCFSIPLPYANGRIAFFSILLFLLWIIEGDFNSKIKVLLNNRPFILLTAFLTYSMLSLLWTKYLEVGLETLNPYKYFIFILPPLITSIPKEKVKGLIFAFVLGVILHAVAAYEVQFLNLTELKFNKIYTPYAIFSPFTAFCSLYFLNSAIQQSKVNSKTIVFLLISILLMILLFLMPGRSGQLSYLIALLLLVFLYHKKILTTITILTIVALSVTSLVINIDKTKNNYLNAKNQIHDVLIEKKYVGSWGVRVGLLQSSIETAKQHPIFGAGIGDSRDAFHRIIERGYNQSFYSMAFWDSSHNQYMTFLMKLGLIGLVLFLTYIIMLSRLKIEDNELKKLSLIFIVLFAANCFADEILFMKPYNTFFAVMSALFLNLTTNKKIANRQSPDTLS